MKWIKVSDRLPENDDTVLVFNIHDGIGTGDFTIEYIHSYIESDGSIFYTHDGWTVYYEWAPHSTPTHWMPYPPEPE